MAYEPTTNSPEKRATHGTGALAGGSSAVNGAIAQDARRAELAATAGGSVRVPRIFGNLRTEATPGRILPRDTFPAAPALFRGSALSAPWPYPSRCAFAVRSDGGPDAGDALSLLFIGVYREGDCAALRIGILESDGLVVALRRRAAAVERAAKSLGERGFTVEPSGWMDSIARYDLWCFLCPVIGNLISRSVAGHEDANQPHAARVSLCATSGIQLPSINSRRPARIGSSPR